MPRRNVPKKAKNDNNRTSSYFDAIPKWLEALLAEIAPELIRPKYRPPYKPEPKPKREEANGNAKPTRHRSNRQTHRKQS